MQKQTPRLLLGCAVWLTMISVNVQGADQRFSTPSADVVREQTLAWVAQQKGMNPTSQEAITALWNTVDETTTAQELLDVSVNTFALADADTQAFVERCALVGGPLALPEAKVLDSRENEHYNGTLRLYFARYLAQRRMYDEALEQFGQIDPTQVIDPATYLFYTAVCQQQLLLKTDGLATLDNLLTKTENVPVRYASVAKLMQYELEHLRQDSLDEIAAKMNDVERRLDLGRGGQIVQKKEAEIIAALDYLIEKLEQQAGNCSGSCPCNGNGNSRSNQSNSPANDSSVKGATAPGNADRKRVANRNGWGNLPAKEQAEAKQYVDETFPPHYKKAMEEFRKKLAERKKN